MPKKTFDLTIVVPILMGIIVLLGVYIIVNQKTENHVRFAVPEVSHVYEDNVIRSEPIFLQQPTFFNPNREQPGSINNFQMKEPFSSTEFISSISGLESTMQSPLPATIQSSMPNGALPNMNSALSNGALLNGLSHMVPSPSSSVIPYPMSSTPDSASSL